MKGKRYLRWGGILLALGVLTAAEIGGVEYFRGRVVRILDGRTLDVFCNTERVRVYIPACDGMTSRRQTREAVEAVVAGEVVTVRVLKRHHGQVTGDVLLESGASLCQELEKAFPGQR